MSPLVSVQIAARALRVNKLRSALTVLGIVVGVAAVVCLGARSYGNHANYCRNSDHDPEHRQSASEFVHTQGARSDLQASQGAHGTESGARTLKPLVDAASSSMIRPSCRVIRRCVRSATSAAWVTTTMVRPSR